MRLASSTGKDWVSEAGVIEPRSDLGWETIEEYQVKDIANLQISQTGQDSARKKTNDEYLIFYFDPSHLLANDEYKQQDTAG